MKRISKIMVLVIMLSMSSLIVGAAVTFNDVSGDKWYSAYINHFSQKGYIKGYSDGTFRPNQSMTRAEFVKVVNRTFGLTNKASYPFTDVYQSWQKDEVAIGVAAGYLSTQNTKFRPDHPITREEASKIIGSLGNYVGDGKMDFKDKWDIADYARKYVDGLVEAGILDNRDYFRPKSNITRAEAVKMLQLATEGPINIPVHSVYVNKSKVTLTRHNYYQLSAGVKPDNASVKTVTYSSDKPKVASVDSSGKIRALAPGTARITIKSKSNPSATTTVTVTVKEKLNPGSGPFYPAENHTSMTALVDKTYYLPKSYVPKDLRVVKVAYYNNSSGPSQTKMRGEAATQLEKMFKDAKSQGIHLLARSGYRSYQTQKELYDRYVAMDGQEAADKYSARPGHSEHQTGLAMDITSRSVGGQLTTKFGSTKEGIWLQKNAHKYGFVMSYSKENEHITGYQYEPWHFRYVGVKAATKIYSNDWLLQDYLINAGILKKQ